MRRMMAAMGVEPLVGRLRQHRPMTLHVERLPPPAKRSSTPSISIVTPSRNQAAFLPQTLDSVLDQAYGELEYIVVDGASTDGSQAHIERVSPRLAGWLSEPDSGQTNALNKGLARTRGEIMGWLNSDDMLLPGSLETVACAFGAHPEVDVVYGHRIIVDEGGRAVGRWIMPSHSRGAYAFADFIPQETMFWRRRAWEKAGGALDESFRFAMDWDLIERFDRSGARFLRLPRFLAAFRVHEQQKTSLHMDSIGAEESEIILRRLHGRRMGRLERTVRLVPYFGRHLLEDRRNRHGYRQLLDGTEKQ